MHGWKWIFFLSAFGLMLSACQFGAQDKDLHTYVQNTLARKGASLEKLVFPQTIPPFVYQKQGLRDPFKPFFAVHGQGPDTKRPKEELELFALDSLKMVGELSRNRKDWAMIRTPDDIVHFITIGNHLGQNFGKVVSIHAEGIELIEFMPTSEGGWEERRTTMDMIQET